MSFDPNDGGRSPYAPPQTTYSNVAGTNYPTPKKHGKLGIASLLISLLVGFSFVTMIVVVGIMESKNPGGFAEDKTIATILGLAVFGFIGLNFVGFILGLVGLFMPDRQKLFSILGVVFNGVVIFGIVGLVVIGLIAG